MKKIYVILIMLSVFVFVKAQSSGEIRTMGPFTSVKALKGINVVLLPIGKEEINIKVENCSVNDIITELNGKELILKVRNKIMKDAAISVFVSYKKIYGVTAATGGFISCDDVIEGDSLNINASSGGTVILDLDYKSINVKASAGSKIELTGKVNTQKVSVTSTATYIADQLKSEKVEIVANSFARADINVSDYLKAKASTGAKIGYFGEPEKVFVTGKVEKY